MSEISRRSILSAAIVGVGAAALMTSPAVAGADPIFMAIEKHRLAEVDYSAACGLTDEVAADNEGREVTAEDEAVFDAADSASEASLEEMTGMTPTTLAGVRALLEYAQGLDWDEVMQDCVAAVLRSPALGATHV